jgi:hypothetical protein
MTKLHVVRRLCAVSLALLALGIVVRVGAAPVSDQQLFEFGKQALDQNRFTEAAMFLFAYLQRNPPVVEQNPGHSMQVNDAISYAKEKVDAAFGRVSMLEQENRDLKSRLGIPASNVSGLERRPRLDPPGPAPQTSYPMVCRGGGLMRFMLMTSGFGMNGTIVAFEYRRSAGAGAASLNSGECTWLDRPINATEPNWLCDPVAASSLQVQWASENGQVRGLSSASAPYLAPLISGDEVLTFQVFNNRQGCMVATARPPLGRGRERLGRGRAQ